MKHILKAKSISKSFFGVNVLNSVNFEAYAGEVHALMGENGAGKSTLMKILAGVYSLDSGTIELQGQEQSYHKPKDAIDAGVTTIHQELNMCVHLSVLENLFLSSLKTTVGGLLVDRKTMRSQAIACLKAFGLEGSVDDIVKNLPISKQQVIEIARAVASSSKVLIMDEPTSSLSSRETDELFKIINDLKKTGMAIIYITHRLEELPMIADRVTVLRDGNFVMSELYANTNNDEIISAMAGRAISEKYPKVNCKVGQTIFEVKNLSLGSVFKDISFAVKEGEILGFAGLVGAGRTEIMKSIFGYFKKDSGSILFHNKEIKVDSIKEAIDHGIAYISEDRKQEGLAIKMSVLDNYAIFNSKAYSKTGFINFKALAKAIWGEKERFKIKMNSPSDRLNFLSGGNQQKVLIGAWLHKKPKVVIFDEPTRGVDVNAKVNIYHTINELKQAGVAVIMVSSELPELMGMADRIAVISEGRLTGEVVTASTSQEKILQLATQIN